VTPPEPKRIVCALSGGVDSAVAAILLQKEGYEVVGVTLRLQKCENAEGSRSCCGVDGVSRARGVCDQLGIRHYLLDCVNKFEEQVLQPAWNDYRIGRTPSPCLLCNERIKFGYLLEWAKSLGIPQVATGHYARIVHPPGQPPQLWRGLDGDKDQTYFLSGLTLEQLDATFFPLGGMTKPPVRALAAGTDLPCAETPESQDACLITEGQSFAEMLRLRFKGEAKPGEILDEQGKTLGHHNGIHHYTIGQRHGIPVESTNRTYVRSIDGKTGDITITHDTEALASKSMTVIGLHWLHEKPLDGDTPCQVQTRYRSKPANCTLHPFVDGKANVTFASPIRAVTPGQAAVFYDGDRVMGRGWIDAAL
jgi:tRNA-specific 2-thiouridylase